MRQLMIASLTLGALLMATTPAAAATNTRETLDQIVLDAQKVRVEAQEIKQLLRASRPDLAAITQRLEALTTHADALKQTMDDFDATGAGLSSTQLAAFERARVATDTLRVMLQNKASMLADPETVQKNRTLLRAKADGIAKRADIVQQQVTRIRT